MALTINTNMTSLQAQHALSNSTQSLNQSIKRMTTGYKINSASDDAAGLAVANKMKVKISAVTVAQSNVELGNSLLSTLEGNYGVIQDHLQRIRDLTEQSANGTYSTDSLVAIKDEISQRLDEITRVSRTTEYNDLYLLTDGKLADGSAAAVENKFQTDGCNLQVGVTSSENSVITLDKSLFASAVASSLTWKATGIKNTDGGAVTMPADQEAFSKACAGLSEEADLEGTKGANQMLAVIDYAISNITERTTLLGATMNRLDSASSALEVQSDNLTSSLSTVKDADIAAESSSYISAQILQQASATLLATANQTPQIALNLI